MTREEREDLEFVLRDVALSCKRLAEAMERIVPQIEWLQRHEAFRVVEEAHE